MSSETNVSTTGQLSRVSVLADAGPDSLPESIENSIDSGGSLTHAQRVERELAYLRRRARQGIWSAIE
jgi:hypothetical protein